MTQQLPSSLARSVTTIRATTGLLLFHMLKIKAEQTWLAQLTGQGFALQPYPRSSTTAGYRKKSSFVSKLSAVDCGFFSYMGAELTQLLI
jgi:hypothetical protein